MGRPTIVIKIGGRTLSARGVLERLTADIRRLSAKPGSYGQPLVVVVHGGGGEVTELAGRLGITSEFVDGVRMTGEEEMDAVDMVLSGLVNKRVARRFEAEGVPAVGISASDGGLLSGEPVTRPDGSPSRTGTVSAVNPDLLEHLLSAGYVVVVASTIMDADGRGLNLNADDAALAIASMLSADTLVFLSDVPGIMRTGTEVIDRLTPEAAEAEIASGSISGGMIPKVRSSIAALQAGVGTVIIGSYTEDVSLERLIGGRSGTRIEP
jgi:acetylglutamate kinase